MELISGIGWLAAAFFPAITPAGAWVAENTDAINEKFVERVDSGYSCWTRVGGDIGVYGHPGNYSLDPVCYIVGKKDLPVATPYAVSEEACGTES